MEDVKGVVVETSPLPVVWWSDIRETRGHHPVDHLLPDLADPATLGCLLALVREAWGDPDLCALMRPTGIVEVLSWSHRYVDGPTEAEALVNALRAAPGRTP